MGRMADAPDSESPERPDIRLEDDPRLGHHSEVQQPQPTACPTTNGTAIVALAATLVPFPFIGGILGIVLGVFGLREIHRYRQLGGAVAVAAIIVGSVQLALALISPIVIFSVLGVRP